MDNEKYQLIEKAIKGNEAALDKLIKDEQNNIYTTLFYLNKDYNDIQDILQEILIKIVRNIKNLKNPLSFKSWLNKITMNAYYDNLRKSKNKVLLVDDSQKYLSAIDIKNSPQDKVLYSELDVIIKKTILNMPEHYKIPITLREVQGLSYDEISNITNSSIGTVKSRISRARSIIQDNIIKYTGE